jgi:1-deoxy-D-xylulose-5-phosphate synthase
MVETAEAAADLLARVGIGATVVNARFAKPLSEEHYRSILSAHDLVVTLEDGVRSGGYGSAVGEIMADLDLPRHHILLGHPSDRFVDHGDNKKLFAELELDAPSVAARIRTRLETT